MIEFYRSDFGLFEQAVLRYDIGMNSRNLAIIAPCFNEEKSLAEFTRAVFAQLARIRSRFPEVSCQLVLVDDGSVDDTWEVIEGIRSHAQFPTVGLRFSRNFGHQAAICAGLDYAFKNLLVSEEDTFMIMDSDGQHPPEFISSLFESRMAGFHHVQMIRKAESQTWFKRFTGSLFYRLFRFLSGLRLPSGAADFRAFSGLFLAEYLRFNETVRFNRGLFHWLGFETKFIPYVARKRIAGKSSYSFFKMLKLAIEGITYFSSKPLIYTIGATTLMGFLFCLAYGLYNIILMFEGASFAPGWPTLIFVVTLWGSLVSFGQLLLALYVARIFDETKKRPVYVLQAIADESKNSRQEKLKVVLGL